MRKLFLKISLIVFIFTGLFADFIANDKPVLCKDSSGYKIPVLTSGINSDDYKNCKILLNPPVKYSYKTIDTQNASYASPLSKQTLKPGQQRHILGTDQIGRDVLAGMLHGMRIALKTGVLAMALALFIALIMGIFPAYYGNRGLRKKRIDILILMLTGLILIYIFINIKLISLLSIADLLLLLTAIPVFTTVIYFIFKMIPGLQKPVPVPLDNFIDLITKLFQSMPGIFLLLILISLFSTPSIYHIIIVIGILKWPLIARYIRAEILKIKEEKYIEASRALGLKDRTIIFRHVMPHIWTPVIVALSFGFASTILLESILSFLGIGIPADHVSWGSLLSEARQNYSAWWLAIFPGLAIFWIIFVFNEIGTHLQSRIDK